MPYDGAMKKSFFLFVTALVACGGSSNAPPPKTTSSTSAPVASATKQKGIMPGYAILVGMRSNKPEDADLCWTITDKEADVADFNKDRKKSLEAAKVKLKLDATSELVDACPVENVIGTCQNAFKMLVDYYSPTWTPDKARKHCADDQMGKWVE